MADPQQVLAQRVHDAIVASFGPDFGDADPLIRPSSFADYQSNAALPLVTVAGLQFGNVIAFAIITETVFQWPGMGLLFIQAVQFADIPVMAAYLCLIAFIFVLINLIVDLLYAWVDPRIRLT